MFKFPLRKWFSHLSSKSHSDTIYALASGYGKSSVAVIRISGEKSFNVLSLLSKNKQEYSKVSSFLEVNDMNSLPHKFILRSHYVNYRTFYNPFNNFSVIDYGLLLFFEKPKSFTGENVYEIQCHGGSAVKQEFLEVLGKLPYFRHAEAGEFTKKAFINKKLDILKVEALADILNSETQQQKELSINQFSGYYLRIYEELRNSLIKCLAHSEAFIDFEEEEDDVKTELYAEVGKEIDQIIKRLQIYLNQYHLLKTSKERLNISIIGPPNVGKSSLMNILCQKDIAIVSDIPGTTRDIVSNHLDLFGNSITLNDTAGLRSTNDLIEKMGIEKTVDIINHSFIITIILDLFDLIEKGGIILHSKDKMEIKISYIKEIGLGDYFINHSLQDKNILFVFNKSDKVTDFNYNNNYKVNVKGHVYDCVFISVLKNTNINILIDKILYKIKQNRISASNYEIKHEDCIITRERHKELIEIILNHLIKFRTSDQSVDICVEELREAVKCFGRLLGKIDVEEILDVLFKDFCIGK